MTNLCAPYNNHKIITTLLPLTSIGIFIFVVIIGGICLVLSIIQRKEEYTLLPNIREKLPWLIYEIFRLCVSKFQCHNLIIKGSFNNYVDIILPFLTSPLCMDSFYTLSVDKNRLFWPPSPPHLVHVVQISHFLTIFLYMKLLVQW